VPRPPPDPQSDGAPSPQPHRHPDSPHRQPDPATPTTAHYHAVSLTFAHYPTNSCHPHYRFDPRSGAFRTRYAGATLAGTFRERYRSTGLVIPADHRTHHLVRLVSARNLRVLDLRTEKNLDVLQVDDQISTGQHPDVWATCHRLVDAARRWWTDIDAIVYRSRTTPESSLNYAFFGDDDFDVESWPLASGPTC
jgi:hypothetical protein